MRTTVELPTELLRAAKIRAAERGETLKELFSRAVANELGFHVYAERQRVELPIVGAAGEPTVEFTNADIEDVLAAEDAGRYASR
jgi:hypothetical protein